MKRIYTSYLKFGFFLFAWSGYFLGLYLISRTLEGGIEINFLTSCAFVFSLLLLRLQWLSFHKKRESVYIIAIMITLLCLNAFQVAVMGILVFFCNSWNTQFFRFFMVSDYFIIFSCRLYIAFLTNLRTLSK